MILAEELDADWKQIRVQQAMAGEEYGDMSAAGSTSVSNFYTPLREAGALARQMLLLAAAAKTGAQLTDLEASDSVVVHRATGDEFTYAELLQSASQMEIPEVPELKSRNEFKLLGKDRSSVDLRDIISGRAVYGIDVEIEGMKYAAVARCPVRGGKLMDFDAREALAIPGVLKVVEIPTLSPISYAEVCPGVAVIAESTAVAFKGRESLQVRWDQGPTQHENSESYASQYKVLKEKPWEVELRRTSGFDAAEKGAERVLKFDYELPFWAHFCMEPMNFTAHYRAGSCHLTDQTSDQG
jgi:isoquinoline 1-oxidoreductase beta subunit